MTMVPSRIRVVFMGSDSLSVPYLETLASCPMVEVALVATSPDRGRGRGLKVSAGPVKVRANELGIETIAPIHVNDDAVLAGLRGVGADVFVVMAYGQFLGPELLAMPPLGCLNMHVSLLPRWRGAAPIQRAILAGDSETGVSAMLMDAGMDTGDVLGSVRVPIGPRDTSRSVADALAGPGCALMLRTLRDMALGTAVRTPQDGSLAVKAPKIKRGEASLDFTLSAAENERKVRAFFPKPVAETFLPGVGGRGLRLKVLEAEVETLPHGMALAVAGTLLELDRKRGPLVAGGKGKALRLLRVQPEGRTAVSGADFSNGWRSRVPIGIRLEKVPEV
ncbi:MAG: methionyl-tRNA formyltransferase [Kiritimatiellae bacterium]|nr:methionyl-tRNA formyltransferase [Kiritimatiellia bacterium]